MYMYIGYLILTIFHLNSSILSISSYFSINSEKKKNIRWKLQIQTWSPKEHGKKTLMCATLFSSFKTEDYNQNHQHKTKIQKEGMVGGRGANIYTHTHSTDWLLHLQGWRVSGSLYRLRSDNKSGRLSTHHPTTTNTFSCPICTQKGPDTTGWL